MTAYKILFVVSLLVLVGIVIALVLIPPCFLRIGFSDLGKDWAECNIRQYGFSYEYPVTEFPLTGKHGRKFKFFQFTPNDVNLLFHGQISDWPSPPEDLNVALISVRVYDETISSRIENWLTVYDGTLLQDKITTKIEEKHINGIDVTKISSQINGRNSMVSYFFSAPKDAQKTVEFYVTWDKPESFFDKFESSFEIVR